MRSASAGVARDGGPADHVRVAVQVLGRGVHHDRRPELERPLEDRRREGVVHDERRARAPRDLGDGGDVEDLQRRVGGRLHPDEPRRGPHRGAHRPRARACRPWSSRGRAASSPCRASGRCRRRRRRRRRRGRPSAGSLRRVDVAASPLANANPCVPPSSAARHASSARRVGLPLREYSKPLCTPGASCAKVLASTMGVITAPLWASAAARRGSRGCRARVPRGRCLRASRDE